MARTYTGKLKDFVRVHARYVSLHAGVTDTYTLATWADMVAECAQRWRVPAPAPPRGRLGPTRTRTGVRWPAGIGGRTTCSRRLSPARRCCVSRRGPSP